jgi:phosphoglycerate dehydrogenase-like enzyme
MLHFNKQFKRCEQNRLNKKWDVFEMDVMKNKTVGLLGYGSIGKTTGEKVKSAFGCKVIALRRNKDATDESGVASEIYGYDEKAQFFSQCDFVVCSLPNTPETVKFIGQDEINSMKPNTVFVNIGRGSVVDEEALVLALKSGHLKGAVLDVFAVEPLPEASPLWEMENVILTSHNADTTYDNKALGHQVWHDNLIAFLEGSSYATPVDIRRGY